MPREYYKRNMDVVMKEQRKEGLDLNTVKLKRIVKGAIKNMPEDNAVKKGKRKNVEMYPYCYIYGGKKVFLIWQTREGAADTFKLDLNGRLISAKSAMSLKVLIGNKSKDVKWSEGCIINFDKFWKALMSLKVGKSSSKMTCKLLLDGWNFIEDLARTFGLTKEIKSLRTPLLSRVYKKLFWGNNLPAVTPIDKSYSPLWEKEEISLFKKEFKLIWKMFSHKIRE